MAQSDRLFAETKEQRTKKPLSPQLVQCVVCALLVLAVFGLYRTGSPVFAALRDRYEALMQTDYCADGVWTAAQRIARTVSQAPEAVQEAVQSFAHIDEQAPIETVASAGGEDIRILDALQDTNFDAVTVSEPAVLPVAGTISSPFGFRTHPITGKKNLHTGLDIAAPMGTPIAAAYDGTVLETGQTDGRGKFIRLRHGDDMQTMYCHLSEIRVREGDNVAAGDEIGLVGSTGMSTGPHLHFEVWIDGVRCNPIYVLHDLIDA